MKFEEALKLCRKKHGYHDDEEHRIQTSCVRWFREIAHGDIAMSLNAVPNGGLRGKRTAAKLKEEGVLAGVADLELHEGNSHYRELFIEMKTAKGRQSYNQKRYEEYITSRGCKYVICRSRDEFIYEIENYLKDR